MGFNKGASWCSGSWRSPQQLLNSVPTVMYLLKCHPRTSQGLVLSLKSSVFEQPRLWRWPFTAQGYWCDLRYPTDPFSTPETNAPMPDGITMSRSLFWCSVEGKAEKHWFVNNSQVILISCKAWNLWDDCQGFQTMISMILEVKIPWTCLLSVFFFLCILIWLSLVSGERYCTLEK